MKIFKDTAGRDWTIDVNVMSIERVKSHCEINLPDLFADNMALLTKLFDDHVLLGRVLWSLCGTSVTPSVEFLQALKGDILETAANMLVEDVIDFFPSRRRETLRAAVKKIWQIVDTQQAKGLEILEGIDPTSLPFATSSGASSGSTPEVLPPAS